MPSERDLIYYILAERASGVPLAAYFVHGRDGRARGRLASGQIPELFLQ